MQKIQNVKWAELNLIYQEDPESIKEQSIRLSRIIDTNYKKDNLEQEDHKLIHLNKL